ncbi:MAG: hypothetical protein HQ536_04560 [Parcubacteria group bacterium]|nr:hypothetical protein [Parcubacteria group bacterium]
MGNSARLVILLVGFVVAFFVVCVITGCEIPEAHTSYVNAESSSEGVVLRGHESSGWIENTSDFPVRIKVGLEFYQYNRSVTMFRLGVGERRYLQKIRNKNVYYIYNIDGGLIGLIRPVPNGTE